MNPEEISINTEFAFQSQDITRVLQSFNKEWNIMSTQVNKRMANNPLVGKTVVIRYETGAPGASFEINFFSHNEKTSTGRGAAEGYFATDNYEMTVVAPNIYMVSWMRNEDGHVVTAVWNLNDMKAYGSYSNPEPKRIFMTGIINEIRE